MNITERTKDVMRLVAIIICAYWLVSYAADYHYKFTVGDTIGIAWDKPTDGGPVRYYSLCVVDSVTQIKSWQTFSTWDTVTCAPKLCTIINVPLPVGSYCIYLIAGNDGGQSEPSDPVWLRIVEPTPKKPCCIMLFLKKFFGIEQSASPSAGKKRWMQF